MIKVKVILFPSLHSLLKDGFTLLLYYRRMNCMLDWMLRSNGYWYRMESASFRVGDWSSFVSSLFCAVPRVCVLMIWVLGGRVGCGRVIRIYGIARWEIYGGITYTQWSASFHKRRKEIHFLEIEIEQGRPTILSPLIEMNPSITISYYNTYCTPFQTPDTRPLYPLRSIPSTTPPHSP